MVNPNMVVDLTNDNKYHYCLVNSRRGYHSARKLFKEEWKTLIDIYTDVDAERADLRFSNTRPYMVPVDTLIGEKDAER